MALSDLAAGPDGERLNYHQPFSHLSTIFTQVWTTTKQPLAAITGWAGRPVMLRQAETMTCVDTYLKSLNGSTALWQPLTLDISNPLLQVPDDVSDELTTHQRYCTSARIRKAANNWARILAWHKFDWCMCSCLSFLTPIWSQPPVFGHLGENLTRSPVRSPLLAIVNHI